MVIIAPPAIAAACERNCGGVEIPYPFGLDPNCSLPGFNLSCNTSGDGKPYYNDVEVLSISLPEAQARMRMDISSACYDESSRHMSYNSWGLNLRDTPFRYSNSGNRFTAIGCKTLAYIAVDSSPDDRGRSRVGVGSPDDRGSSLTTGCVATCGLDGDGVTGLTDGACSGIGCCQTAIPNGFQSFEIRFDENFNTTSIYDMSRCSYAALVEAYSFTFFANYSTSSAFNDYYRGQAPIIVDWSIGNKTCNEAQKTPGYACVSSHSECFNSSNGPGYICNCSQGFQGNPYLMPEDPGSCKERPVTEIVAPEVLEEATMDEINAIAEIANACLRLRSEERPTMKQVEMPITAKMIDLSLRPPFITTATTTLLCLITLTAAHLAAGAASSAGCQRKCGDVQIPYPFGIQSDPPGCAMPGFELSCNHTTAGNNAMQPMLLLRNVEVLDISLPEGQVRMKMDMTYDCYNTSTHKPECVDRANLNFTGSPFTFSNTANKFTVLGCRMLAFLGPGNQRDVGSNLTVGCSASCGSDDDLAAINGGGCSGTGCCQTAVPKGIDQALQGLVRRSLQHVDHLQLVALQLRSTRGGD
ncbi:hypothetical protein GUJ93_ZPchr0004g39314 [Zizania palustris]|uniref:Wall-associated receptor kinase galacturonan-binding domain-containing protein n=1 Tax=Zizania palustris TaxID=103762 RepID=A0A8J5VLV9_ZIZPA|nr:hypothetical protein GUJ93_ZPchr0004g39314 [Zizania palustris]